MGNNKHSWTVTTEGARIFVNSKNSSSNFTCPAIAKTIDALRAENKELKVAYQEATSLLRSSHSIASREGNQTRWEQFRNGVGRHLKKYHPLSNRILEAQEKDGG